MYVRDNPQRRPGLGQVAALPSPTGVYPAWGPYGPSLDLTAYRLLQRPVVVPAESVPLAPAPTPALPSPAAAAPSTIQATAPSGASVTQSAGPPGSWPTNRPYTDAAGNVWNFDQQKGWQITTSASTAAAGSGFIATAQAWLLSSSLISALPNYATVGIVVVGGILLMKFMGGGAEYAIYKGKRR